MAIQTGDVFNNINVVSLSSSGSITAGSITTTSGDMTIPDKIVHTGDTNTAIRFPANDTVTVETNGSERLRITSAGNVGIGTTNPNEKLTVVGSISAYSNDATVLTLERPSTLNVSCGFKNNNGTTFIGRTGSDIFSVGTSNNLLSNPLFFINNIGNVGIGTNTPTAKLDVRGGQTYINGQLSFTDASGIPFLDNWIGRYNDGSTDWLHIGGITTSSIRRIGMYANRVYFNGSVGIGTTNPNHNLTVVGYMSAYNPAGGVGNMTLTNPYEAGLSILNPSNSQQWDILNSSASSPLVSRTLSFYNRNIALSVLTLSGQNVGMGTQSPRTRLHIESSGTSYSNPSDSNAAGIYILNNNNTNSAAHAYVSVRTAGANGGDPFISYDINGVTGWSTGIDNSDGDKFKIANSWSNVETNTRLTIDNSGNVGIGTTTPSSKLDVNGSLNVTGTTALGITKINRQNNTTEGGEIQLARASDNNAGWHIDTLGSGNSPSLRIFDSQTQTVRMVIEGNGKVGIGTVSTGDYTPVSTLHIKQSSLISYASSVSGQFDHPCTLLLENFTGVAAGTEPIAQIVFRPAIIFGNKASRIVALPSDPPSLAFCSGATEVFRSTASGVGIGTSTPSRMLDVAGDIRSTGNSIINNTAPTLYLQDTNNRSGMIHVNDNVMYFLRGSGNNSLDWTPLSNSQWPLFLDLENGNNVVGGGLFVQNGIVNIQNTAGVYRFVRYTTTNANRTTSTIRFDAGIDDSAESGSNAGSNYFVHRFSDDGTFLGRPLSINRSNGNVTLENSLHVSTANATGGGIILADDGDIVDLNDGFCSMRFSNGVRIYSGNKTGTPTITLSQDGTITSGNGLIYSGSLLLQHVGGNAYVRPTNVDSHLYLGANNLNILTIRPDKELIFGGTTRLGQGLITFIPDFSDGAGTLFWNRAATTAESQALQFRNNQTVVGSIRYDDRKVIITGNLEVRNNVTSNNTAKAWANFNGSNLGITGSFNVSSITRISTGVFAVNLTTPLADTNHATIGSGSGAVGYNDVNFQTSTASANQVGITAVGILGATQAGVNATDISIVTFNNA